MKWLSKLEAWLDERIGHRSLLSQVCEEPLPGGARWTYVFGYLVLVQLCFQVLTGFLLALSYSPGSDSAHASVKFIMEESVLGWFIRSLHHYGAGFLVVLIFFHGLQVFLFGAYKRPREMNWILGVLLAGLIFALAFTGYLLPWDQRAYWATKVGTSIMGSAPLAGPIVQTVVQGGKEVGNLTLTRFYAAHLFLLPTLTLLGLGAHFLLCRKQGLTPPPGVPDDAPGERYWPAQMVRNMVTAILVVGALFLLAGFFPAKLGEPADASVDYPARPEWYFLFLFQLLKYFEGPFEKVGTVVVPPLLALAVLLIPFLDRSPSRAFARRKFVLGLGGFLAAGWVALTCLAIYDDYRSGHYKEVALWEAKPDPNFDVDAYYNDNCRKCHARKGTGNLEKTPDFTSEAFWSGVRSPVRLVKTILEGVPDPSAPEDERMPAFGDRLTPSQAKALVLLKIEKDFRPATGAQGVALGFVISPFQGQKKGAGVF